MRQRDIRRDLERRVKRLRGLCSEIARRSDVSHETVRCWLSGRIRLSPDVERWTLELLPLWERGER